MKLMAIYGITAKYRSCFALPFFSPLFVVSIFHGSATIVVCSKLLIVMSTVVF